MQPAEHSAGRCPPSFHALDVGLLQVKLNFKLKRGEAKCTMCSEYYNCEINAISEEIDVYSDWIDECEKVNNS
jgi:transcription elongation factor Elf1